MEDAARAGEEGRLVRSWLGRTCPPPSDRWRELVAGPDGDRAARDRGRFTRNFVVQATAAEWALTLMAVLRGLLPDPARLVFFQHDEVMVHCPPRWPRRSSWRSAGPPTRRPGCCSATPRSFSRWRRSRYLLRRRQVSRGHACGSGGRA